MSAVGEYLIAMLLALMVAASALRSLSRHSEYQYALWNGGYFRHGRKLGRRAVLFLALEWFSLAAALMWTWAEPFARVPSLIMLAIAVMGYVATRGRKSSNSPQSKPTRVAPGLGFGRFFLVAFVVVAVISAITGRPKTSAYDTPLPGEEKPVGRILYGAQSAVMFTVGVSVLGAFAPELAFCGLAIVAKGEEIQARGSSRP